MLLSHKAEASANAANVPTLETWDGDLHMSATGRCETYPTFPQGLPGEALKHVFALFWWSVGLDSRVSVADRCRSLSHISRIGPLAAGAMASALCERSMPDWTDSLIQA